MEIKNMTFNQFEEEIKGEGLVMLGAGGNPNAWLNGIAVLLKHAKISSTNVPDELYKSAAMLTTTGGRHDLVLELKNDKVEYGKLALWRINFGDCSWISDYKVNYANQH